VNKSRVKKVILALIILLVIAQFVQPKRTNPPVVASRSLEAHLPVPAQVSTILKRTCYNCHSSDTLWPWYSHVAPISWLVISDVNEGRSHINFQDWEAQENPKEASEHIGLICKEVRDATMPPLSYRVVHKESRLSSDDVNVLCAWSQRFGTLPESGEHMHH
jgi:hypothetical protein